MVWIAADILHTWGVKCEKQKSLTVRDGGGETDKKSLGHWWHNWPTEAGWSLLYVFPVNWDNIHTHTQAHTHTTCHCHCYRFFSFCFVFTAGSAHLK